VRCLSKGCQHHAVPGCQGLVVASWSDAFLARVEKLSSASVDDAPKLFNTSAFVRGEFFKRSWRVENRFAVFEVSFVSHVKVFTENRGLFLPQLPHNFSFRP